MVQTNTAALSLAEYGVPPLVSGVVFAAIIGLVIFGGIKRIGRFTSMLVPIMSAFYILGSIIILVIYAKEIPGAFVLIFKGAFGGQAAVGGFAGATAAQAIRFGIARGVFSNEAGCGSAPIAHSAAKVKYAAEQGMYGIVEVFLDTVVIGTATALAIVVTGAWSSGADGAVLSIKAFESVFGSFGGFFIAISVILFALSTVIGWSWYGETAASYLFGKRMGQKFILPYRVIWIILSVVGAKMALRPIWATADVALGLAVLTSLTALLILNGKVVKLAKEYFASNEFVKLKKEVNGK
jgi:AGCS family alanine or glycine:cation symporter